ncbi:hypothetical protein H4I96_09697 [Botrytis cinerea]
MQPFTYLVPALFFNATVNTVKPLGHNSFGAALGLFEFESATLYSEPEFDFQFSASVASGINFATTNENAGISSPDFRGTVVPNDGAAPFQMKMSGVQLVLTPTFRGGESKYKTLENSVFVASETVSDSGIPGKFLLGVKISKVLASRTNITIGEEFSVSIST